MEQLKNRKARYRAEYCIAEELILVGIVYGRKGMILMLKLLSANLRDTA